MSSIFETAAAVARDAVAPVFCAAGGLQRAGLDLVDRATRGYAPIGLPRAVQRGLESFCPVPQGPIPLPAPPFEGGQCQGVGYSLDIDVFIPSNGLTQTTSTGGYVGPVGNLNFDYEWNANFERWQFAWNLPNGLRTSTPLGGTLAGGPFAPDTRKIVDIRMRRADGLPDECGNPPPVFPPWLPPRPPTLPCRVATLTSTCQTSAQ